MRFLDVDKIRIDEAFDARRIFNADKICVYDVLESVLPCEDKIRILFDNNRLQYFYNKFGAVSELLTCALPLYKKMVSECDLESEIVGLISDLSTCNCSAECIMEYRDLMYEKFSGCLKEYFDDDGIDRRRRFAVVCFLGALYYALYHDRLSSSVMHVINFLRESMLCAGKREMASYASTFVMHIVEKHAVKDAEIYA